MSSWVGDSGNRGQGHRALVFDGICWAHLLFKMVGWSHEPLELRPCGLVPMEAPYLTQGHLHPLPTLSRPLRTLLAGCAFPPKGKTLQLRAAGRWGACGGGWGEDTKAPISPQLESLLALEGLTALISSSQRGSLLVCAPCLPQKWLCSTVNSQGMCCLLFACWHLKEAVY